MGSHNDNRAESAAAPIPLDYARTFFAGGLRYRTPSGFALLFSFAAADVVMLYAFDFHVPSQTPPIARAFPFFFGLAVLRLLYVIITDTEVLPFSITVDGIIVSEKLMPWAQIDRFGAAESQFGTNISYLFYATKNAPKIHMRLMSAKRIQRSAFDRLAEKLRIEVGQSYPDLKLGVYELYQQTGGY